VVDDGSAATAMLALLLPSFVLLGVSELDGEIEQAIETTADLVGCPGCGAVATLHNRRPVTVRDLPSSGRAVTLIGVKRVWRCHHLQCDVRTWTEQSDACVTKRDRRARSSRAMPVVEVRPRWARNLMNDASAEFPRPNSRIARCSALRETNVSRRNAYIQETFYTAGPGDDAVAR
jgi:zinc-finger of transposase IS204/IS1001/IS1096/IS1165